jgi:ribonuclease HI
MDPPISKMAELELSSPNQAEIKVKYMVHLEFKITNNVAEYVDLIFGLSAALSLGIRQLLVKGDSQLVLKQVSEKCSCNEPRLAAYLLLGPGTATRSSG